MSETLKPGDRVACQIKSYMQRKGIFVRYIKPRVFYGGIAGSKEHCLVQFRPNKKPNRLESSLVKLEELRDDR